jgi:hypothetical protein
MARPQVRGNRPLIPTGRRMATRSTLLQPPLGRPTPPFAQNCTSRAQRLPSSHPTGHTSHGSNSSTSWPPRPSTTPPHTTFSSPDGKARARGSDDQGGAWWPFGCDAGLTTHTPRCNRTHVADHKPKHRGPTPPRLQPTDTTTTNPLPAPRTRRSRTVDS